MLSQRKQLRLKNLEDSIKLANKIFNQINSRPFLIGLYGSLGSGKTFIAGELIKLFLNNQLLNITSPTFNLLNIYDDKIYHYDL